MNIIELTIGGSIPVQEDALGPIPNIFQIETLTPPNNHRGLTMQGEIELQKAIKFFYSLIEAQPPEAREGYIRTWIPRITLQITDILESPFSEIYEKWLPNPSERVTVINPTFKYWAAFEENGVLVSKIRDTFYWPIYMVPGNREFNANNIRSKDISNLPLGSGYVELTPEFNIPTTFDNANFLRAQDDNYTDHIREFINTPQYNLALHVRPKIYKKCSKKECSKCYKKFLEKKKSQKYTSSTSLQSLVQSIYLFAGRVQRKEISFEEGKLLIDQKLEIFEQYSDEGAYTYIIVEKFDNIYIYLCKRYHLKETDCIVGFAMQGTNDFITNRQEPKYRQVIMSASSVPIDEDMSDAVYPSNTGIFVYKDNI